MEKAGSTAAGQHRNPCCEGELAFHKLGLFSTCSMQCRSKHSRDCHAHYGRGDIGAVIDILLQRPAGVRCRLATNHENRIHIEEHCHGAPLLRCLGIKQVDLPVTDRELLKPRGILVEEVSQISSRPAGGSDGKKHVPSPFSLLQTVS